MYYDMVSNDYKSNYHRVIGDKYRWISISEDGYPIDETKYRDLSLKSLLEKGSPPDMKIQLYRREQILPELKFMDRIHDTFFNEENHTGRFLKLIFGRIFKFFHQKMVNFNIKHKFYSISFIYDGRYLKITERIEDYNRNKRVNNDIREINDIRELSFIESEKFIKQKSSVDNYSIGEGWNIQK